MIVSERFIKSLLAYVMNIKSDIDRMEYDTMDMDRSEQLRNLSWQIYQVVKALQQIK
jgi:hypothetical protein